MEPFFRRKRTAAAMFRACVDVESRTRSLFIRIRMNVHSLTFQHCVYAFWNEFVRMLPFPEGSRDIDNHQGNFVGILVRNAYVFSR